MFPAHPKCAAGIHFVLIKHYNQCLRRATVTTNLAVCLYDVVTAFPDVVTKIRKPEKIRALEVFFENPRLTTKNRDNS